VSVPSDSRSVSRKLRSFAPPIFFPVIPTPLYAALGLFIAFTRIVPKSRRPQPQSPSLWLNRFFLPVGIHSVFPRGSLSSFPTFVHVHNIFCLASSSRKCCSLIGFSTLYTQLILTVFMFEPIDGQACSPTRYFSYLRTILALLIALTLSSPGSPNQFVSS